MLKIFKYLVKPPPEFGPPGENVIEASYFETQTGRGA
jgi:hypothetical protein